MKNTNNLGNIIFNDLEKNEYLNKLYSNILYNYSLIKMSPNNDYELKKVNIIDSLRFADLLSKSTLKEKKEFHKMWAQEIITLLNEIYPDDKKISIYANSIFTNIGNYQAKNIIKSDNSNFNLLERIYDEYQRDYLSIPSNPDLNFFISQKKIYDKLSSKFFSYSGPTSMGKSFLMRMYMKELIKKDKKLNFAFIVPTKALINETYKKIIDEDLKELLSDKNYKVLTSSNDIALEGEHNFILVLTPERLLYLLISNEINIDYLFIDEAQKLSGLNSRAPFYYKTIDLLKNRDYDTHFIFASPNIPNPEVYLRLISNNTLESDMLYSRFSPVSQIKYMVDLNKNNLSVYNDHLNKLENIMQIDSNTTVEKFISEFHLKNKKQQNIVYFNGRNKAVKAAIEFSKNLEIIDNKDLDELSREISINLHSDYYLVDIIKKGVAYHIGYLPTSIRMRLEELFKNGKIHTIFCTSTLLEGVNLPADNLFITDIKINRDKMKTIDFKNLVGRVGRISFNLYGNVYIFSKKDKTHKEYLEMLNNEIPNQVLSIDSDFNGLTIDEKKHIIDTLKLGKSEINKIRKQNNESYIMMRKFGLILLKDILSNNNNSAVRNSFSDILNKKDIDKIKEEFQESKIQPDDDINISSDQTSNLIAAISQGLKYPENKNNKFMHSDIYTFLKQLRKIFRWDIYEKNDLGNIKLLSYYSVLLGQWLEGRGIGYILNRAINHKKDKPEKFYVDYENIKYNDSLEHRNIVFSDTLEKIDNIISFKISNYFLRFSTEYKKYHNINNFENDWYEYVEYGTTNKLSILLQRTGFSREVSEHIKKNKKEYVLEKNGSIKLKKSLLESTNRNVVDETKSVLFNMPEIFV